MATQNGIAASLASATCTGSSGAAGGSLPFSLVSFFFFVAAPVLSMAGWEHSAEHTCVPGRSFE
jgi:hypothetical protein